MDGGSLERPCETSDDRTDGTSGAYALEVSLVVEGVGLESIGGVNDGAIVVTSSSWYKMVVPSSEEVER